MISDEQVEAARAAYIQYGEGFDSKDARRGAMYKVYRVHDGVDDIISEHPDRASMELALAAISIRAALEAALAAKPGMVSEEPTMWAEVVGNYEGDGVEWSCHAISDMDSEERPLLELAADTFEVGTIVKIFEPTPAKSEKEERV